MTADITFTITMVPGKGIAISGPIHDKLLCYGLLAAAHDAVQEHHAKPASSIAVATAIPGGPQ